MPFFFLLSIDSSQLGHLSFFCCRCLPSFLIPITSSSYCCQIACLLARMRVILCKHYHRYAFSVCVSFLFLNVYLSLLLNWGHWITAMKETLFIEIYLDSRKVMSFTQNGLLLYLLESIHTCTQ